MTLASLLLFASVVGGTFPVNPVDVHAGAGKIPLGLHMAYFEDEAGLLTRKDVLTPRVAAQFSVSQNKIPNFGFTDSVYWFSFSLRSSEEEPLRRYLEIGYPLLDDIHIYFMREAKEPEHLHLGDRLEFPQRPVDHRNFVIPVGLSPGEPLHVLMRIETSSSYRVPLTLWQPEAFLESDATRIMVQGLYFGVLLVMALYNLFVFVSLRERSYLLYVLFVVSFVGLIAALNGLSYQYLWPHQPWFAEKNLLVFTALAALFVCLFTNEFLGLRHNTAKHFRYLSFMAHVFGLTLLLVFLLPSRLINPMLVAQTMLVLPACLSAGVMRWRQGSVEARYYTVAWSSLLVGTGMFLLTTFGVLPANALTVHGPQVGSVLEVILLSLGLARKLRSLQDDNLRLHADTAQELRLQVEERTQHLSVKTLEAQEATLAAVQAKEEADVLRAHAEKHALQLAELDKQKTVFFQNISHELRTPLTLILNPLESATARLPADKEIGVAAKNSRRLLRLVNQLLDFQKLAEGKQKLRLSPIDLVRFNYICGDYFASACSTKEIEFMATIDGQALQEKARAVHVLGEVDALEKIAFNFLSNALKFTPRGGHIELGLKTGHGRVRIFIRDTGPGISEEGKKKLFQVFSQVDETTTRDYEGTGLGLALAKSLSEEMNGTVGIDSKPGEGSTFWAEFPLCEREKTILDVLLVDDEEAICRSLKHILEQNEGIHSVRAVGTVEAANAMLQEHLFRCVVCDEGLVGESGIEFLGEIAKSHSDTRRVLLTGQDTPGLMQKAVNQAWVHQVILKPFDSAALVSTVAKLVQESPLHTRPEEPTTFEVKKWLLEDTQGQTGVDDTGTFQALEEISGGAGELVLVVDDLPDMRDLIGNALKKKMYRVATAPNGRRGLEIAQEHRPDLIITDWMMPVMSGPELIHELKNGSDLGSIPVILLTAKSDEESKLIGTEVGADAFLGKPFNEQELGSTVRNLLSLKSREREVEALNHQLTENVLKRYLPPDLVDQIIAGETSLEQEPKSVTATILFSDLAGFTRLSEKLRAKKLARILNEYLTAMNAVIFEHGGTVDKFIGDAIMVVFGAPTTLVTEEQAEMAAECAMAMQAQMASLNQKWQEEGIPELKMRIGVHQGPVVVGTFGSEKRSDYTAIGPTVNMASRIEAACPPGKVFISGAICDFLPEQMSEEAGEFELKGIDGKHNLYRLVT